MKSVAVAQMEEHPAFNRVGHGLVVDKVNCPPMLPGFKSCQTHHMRV